MNFEEALSKLKKRNRVTRTGWNGKGMYLILHYGHPVNGHLQDAYPKDPIPELDPDGAPNITQGKPGQLLPCILLKTSGDSESWGEGFSDYVAWTPSNLDLLAEDWMVL